MVITMHEKFTHHGTRNNLLGEGYDRFSYARPEFERSLERWLESIRTK